MSKVIAEGDGWQVLERHKWPQANVNGWGIEVGFVMRNPQLEAHETRATYTVRFDGIFLADHEEAYGEYISDSMLFIVDNKLIVSRMEKGPDYWASWLEEIDASVLRDGARYEKLRRRAARRGFRLTA